MPTRIGIALGGGGARGWAHIGVLRTLLTAGFEPDIIAGTSIGAIVGGAYAAGRLDELEAFARSIDRRSIWRLVDVNLGKGGGLVTGERVASKLSEIIGTHNIEDLKKKFAAVATELPAGHEVWLETGDLITAMRASYAMPGIFVPSPNEGRPLIDGGIANPVPVSACRAMGANVVIAVPLPATHTPAARFARQTPEAELSAWKKATAAFREPERFVARQLFGDEPGALTTASVSVAALNILLDRMTRVRLASDPPDVTVTSEIGRIALLEFDRAEEAIAIGAAATERVLPEIEALVRESHHHHPA
ncbi:MAG: patatin-like phospholipase family protein [Alphaproteobacteria bacterium]|nr:patatin-like phospholipase family protein [Alphaproteobacteria bacterium]